MARDVDIEIQELPERPVAVAHHPGHEADVDDTRRPLYQYLIMGELIGGPSMLRHHGEHIDVMVHTTPGYPDDAPYTLQFLPEGRYAVQHFEGDAQALHAAREAFLPAVKAAGHEPMGSLIQVHIMDELDGVVEQELQVRVR